MIKSKDMAHNQSQRYENGNTNRSSVLLLHMNESYPAEPEPLKLAN